MPSPSSSRRSFSAGSSSRGVNPERCSTGQKRLPGLAKWRPVAAEYSPGLIPQNSTSRPSAITSGTSLPAAAASAAGEGRSSFGSVMALRTIARAARPGRGSVDCSGRSARGGRMTARTLDGRAVAAQIQQELADEVERLASVGARPGLAAVLVGDDEASHIYVGAKQRAAARWGIDSREVALPATATQRQVLDAVAELNADPTVHGIIVQLPLPHGLDPVRVQEAIDPTKDVDGLHPWNEGRVLRGDPGLPPMITPEMVKPGAAVVDTGNHRIEGRLVGDVAPEVAEVAGALTPVPGGVGPMTVAMLMANTITAASEWAGGAPAARDGRRGQRDRQRRRSGGDGPDPGGRAGGGRGPGAGAPAHLP